MTAKEYTRLPGQGTRFDGVRFVAGSTKRCRLWLGKDHLLAVERSWFSEDYRRYYFRDIQAIIVRKTAARRNWNLVLGTIAGLFAFFGCLAWYSSADFASSVAFWSIAVFFAIFLAANTAMGPRCVAHLKTAVQTDPLPSLRHLRNANRVLALLKPRIIKAQGALSPETIAAEAAVGEGRVSASMGRAYSQGQTAQAALKPYRGNAHLLMFWALIPVGLVDLARIFHNSMGMMTVGALFYAVLCGLMVFAMVRQYQTDLRRSLHRLTWIVAATFFINMIVGNTIAGVMAASEARGHITTEFDVMRNIGSIDPLQTTWLMWMLIYDAVTSMGLGIIGLLIIKTGGVHSPALLASAPAPVVTASAVSATPVAVAPQPEAGLTAPPDAP